MEEIYENIEKIKPAWRKKLEEGKDLAFMSKKVAKIFLDAPVEIDFDAADIRNFDYENVLKELRKLEFNSLVRKIPKEMKTGMPQVKDENQIGLFSEEETESFSNVEILPEISAEDFFAKNQSLVFFDFDENRREILVSNFENLAKFDLVDFSKFGRNFESTKTVFFNSKNTFHKLTGCFV